MNPNRPDFSAPQGFPQSDALASASAPFAGMRELSQEEEELAIPVPQKEYVQARKPEWLPDVIDLSHIPEDLREEYFHTDIRAAVEASPLQTEGLEELMLEIERETAQAAPVQTRRRSSFGAAPIAPAPTSEAPVTQPSYAPPTAPAPYAAPAPVTMQQYAQAAAPAPVYSAPPSYVPPAPNGAPQAQPGKPIHHPVFDSLLTDFGLKSDLKHEVYKGHKFTFKQYNADQYTFCISLADTLSTSPMEYSERIRQNLVAVTLVAIDDCPIYEILGRDPRNMGFILTDRLNIPTKMSMLLAESVREMFLEKFAPNVVIDLWSIYDGLFPVAQNQASESGAEEDGVAWRYKCPSSGCNHSVDTIPEIDQWGNPRRLFCPKHGNELVPVGTASDMANIPLA